MRALTDCEIDSLTMQNCFCEFWENISVSDEFDVSKIRSSEFFGKIFIDANVSIVNSTVENCMLYEGASVRNVGLLKNYIVQKNVTIHNVSRIERIYDPFNERKNARFGEGIQVNVLDEKGSCAISLPKSNVEIPDFSMGFIEEQSVVLNTNTIENVLITQRSVVKGATLLQNGVLEAQSYVGAGVIMKDFFLRSAKVEDNAIVERCFIEQSQMGKGFSATDCWIESDCELFNGEAVSLFAGPLTVSHHKSSLLIAMRVSFFNAGSGTNQSNHMYKQGPIHFGIFDRGCKFASGAYLPFPSRVGAFTLIMNKHANKVDVANFPFSYLIAKENHSLLIPAIALGKMGTYRDEKKWQKRSSGDFDCRVLNPYVVQQILKGRSILQSLLKEGKESYEIGGCLIEQKSIGRAIDLYDMALAIYCSDVQTLADSTDAIWSFDYLFEEKEKEEQYKQYVAYKLLYDQGKISSAKDDFVDALSELTMKAKIERRSLVMKDAESEYSDIFKVCYGDTKEERDESFARIHQFSEEEIDALLS